MVNMAGVVINPEEEFIVVDSTAGVFLEPPPRHITYSRSLRRFEPGQEKRVIFSLNKQRI
jgi:hypothetical protein